MRAGTSHSRFNPIRKAFGSFAKKVAFPRPWITVVGGTAALAVAICGLQYGRAYYNLTQAEKHLQRGFNALAAETLEPSRSILTQSPRGCDVMLAAYFGAQRADRLEWVAQACVVSNGDSVSAFVGPAAARELRGRDEEASQILGQVIQAYPKAPEPYLHLTQIYRRAKKDVEAALSLYKAAELIPSSNQIALDALQSLSSVSRWDEARKLAERIKDVETDTPEVKLVIARALLRGGNREAAMVQIEAARTLMQSKPETKTALTQTYADVLTPSDAGDSSRLPATSGASK